MDPPPLPSLWTVSQRRVVLALIAILLAGLSILIWRRPIGYADPPPGTAPRETEIADRLDPNSATADELAAIPTLGEKKAQEIVAYRQSFRIRYPGKRAFNRPEDLMRIAGIGVGTVANLSPFLMFDDSKSPTTRAATSERSAPRR